MKIKEFQSILKQKNIDFAFFFSGYTEKDPNLIYFTGYTGIGALIISKNKPAFLVVPKMELKRVKGIKRITWPRKTRLFHFLNSKLKKARCIGINQHNLTVNNYKGLKKAFRCRTKDISKYCSQLRTTKTKAEIEIIKKGCALSDKILKKTIKNFKEFKTEADVAAFLENEAKKQGCGLAFPTIVASGDNAINAHHEPKKVRLKKGFCIIDFGIKYKNYCTDTTRTVYMGKASKKEKEIYNLLLNVQECIIKKIRLNEKTANLYKKTKKELKTYKKYFTHGLGHGFGVEIHESPNLTEKSKDIFQNNTIFTIEPGIYKKRFGIRIEDDILIHDNKIIMLTKVPKGIIEVRK